MVAAAFTGCEWIQGRSRWKQESGEEHTGIAPGEDAIGDSAEWNTAQFEIDMTNNLQQWRRRVARWMRHRPGPAGVWCAALLTLGALPAMAQPANDNFTDAQMISGASGIIVGSTVGATVEGGEPAHWQLSASGASIWYRWTAPGDGLVSFDTVGSSYDTVLAIYTGADLGSLTLVVNDDDSAGNLRSRM